MLTQTKRGDLWCTDRPCLSSVKVNRRLEHRLRNGYGLSVVISNIQQRDAFLCPRLVKSLRSHDILGLYLPPVQLPRLGWFPRMRELDVAETADAWPPPSHHPSMHPLIPGQALPWCLYQQQSAWTNGHLLAPLSYSHQVWLLWLPFIVQSLH